MPQPPPEVTDEARRQRTSHNRGNPEEDPEVNDRRVPQLTHKTPIQPAVPSPGRPREKTFGKNSSRPPGITPKGTKTILVPPLDKLELPQPPNPHQKHRALAPMIYRI